MLSVRFNLSNYLESLTLFEIFNYRPTFSTWLNTQFSYFNNRIESIRSLGRFIIIVTGNPK